ncbi:hypothetical protein BGZ73_004469 [Actinomortierella ambigua]|nr:hypothetical protein BGZ73_004469 [Actinomortierella ambigua]
MACRLTVAIKITGYGATLMKPTRLPSRWVGIGTRLWATAWVEPSLPFMLGYSPRITVLAPRSLVPVEKTDEHGKIIQGVTWRSDPILTFQIPTRASNAYGEAFMLDERLKWLRNASIVTEYTVEGSHHVHIDDPEMVAKMISAWIIEQDSSVKARL